MVCDTSKSLGARPLRSKRLVQFGWGITALYVAAVIALSWSRHPQLLTMELNALGDFLAGVASPLALIWLVLGFFQQGEELRLQVAELRNSVVQQTELVRVSTRQLDHGEKVAADVDHRYVQERQPEMLYSLRRRQEMSGRWTCFDFKIENIGFKAKRIRLEPSADLQLPQKNFAELGSGKHISTELRCAPKHVGLIDLHVRYVDGAGHERMQTLTLSVEASPTVNNPDVVSVSLVDLSPAVKPG